MITAVTAVAVVLVILWCIWVYSPIVSGRYGPDVHKIPHHRICDNCEGKRGGLPGNGNVVCFGSRYLYRILCDYCWVEKCDCGHIRGHHTRALDCRCHRFSHACAECDCDGFYGAGWMS